MAKQRISYVPLEKMDAAMQEEMRRCEREGTPRPESSAVRAHVPACFWFFANSWRDIFRNGVLDHAIKELCRLYVSRSVSCEYCGNQRSVKATTSGALIEDHVLDLLNFEKSANYDERQKAALAYAEAIVWHLGTDDAFWDRMHRHFSEPELVELGCMIGLTLGQQSWLRLLNIEHHQVMAGTDGLDGAGLRGRQALAATKAAPDYWAKSKVGESRPSHAANMRFEGAIDEAEHRSHPHHPCRQPAASAGSHAHDVGPDRRASRSTQASSRARVAGGRGRRSVGKQREAGIDIVSDGEMSKVGFSNYVMQRYSGFANRAQFVATDLGDFPDIINKLFVENEGGRHLVMPNVEGPIELRDTQAVQRDIANFKAALGGASPDDAFIAAVTPGQMLFNFPNLYYPSRRGLSRGCRQGAVGRIQGDRRRRLQSAARCARSADARALLHRRRRHRRHEDLRADGDRGDERGDPRPAAREGAPAPVLGQLCRPAPSRRRAQGHHRSGAQDQRRLHLFRGRQSAPRARMGGLGAGQDPGRQGADPRRDRHADQSRRASAARGAAARDASPASPAGRT